jgi:hypothetical protein
MDKKAQFDKERENAKTFLSGKLGRAPTAAEILALMGARRRGQKNENVIRNITRKAQERKNLAKKADEAAKAAAAAARKAVREEAKSKKEAAKVLNKEAEDEAARILAEMNENERRAGKAKTPKARGLTAKKPKAEKAAPKVNMNAAAKEIAKRTMKAMKEQEKLNAKAQKEMMKRVKEGLSQERKQLFKLAEEKARKDITDVIGKAPRVANIKRLAAIRTSGANISAKNFLQVRNYRNSRKTAKTVKRVNNLAKNLEALSLDIDVCAACDYKRWLEKNEE